MSRKDAVCEHLRDAAKEGKFEATTPFKLYPSENKKIERQYDLKVKPIKKTKSDAFSKINWENPTWNDPCGEGPPLEVYDYIEGHTTIFPKSITTLAQELYTIAARANYDKAQKNKNE